LGQITIYPHPPRHQLLQQRLEEFIQQGDFTVEGGDFVVAGSDSIRNLTMFFSIRYVDFCL